MAKPRRYQVKEVSALSGVSVRALHHYDEIGLLVPSARSEVGYRLYDDTDLLRLQHIVVSRALGLSLEQIRRSMIQASIAGGRFWRSAHSSNAAQPKRRRCWHPSTRPSAHSSTSQENQT
jgi:DNA-binding transcriptional MerR regulator